MTLSKLIVGGFKSIRECTEIPIAPLTFLFGPNSAGKSAVLEALDELAKKLIEVPEDHSQFTKTIRAFVGEHHSKAHRLARNPGDEEPSHTAVTLGLELDDFPAGETSFIDPAR